MKDREVLDPLWITKGTSSGLDAEYYKYVLLAANQEYREMLNQGNTDRFYEILFHSLNLNNLAINGKIYDTKMNNIDKSPKLIEIREHLKDMYDLPSDMIEIFRNSNYVLVSLLIDYLDLMLTTLDDCKMYYLNKHTHTQKEIFIVRNNISDNKYDVWKLRFDGRYKFSHNLKFVQTLKLKEGETDALLKSAIESGNPELKRMDSGVNVCFISHTKHIEDPKELINAVSNSVVFYRAFDKKNNFDPTILEELREVLLRDRIVPFALKSII